MSHIDKPLVVGIDLHGTLIDDTWEIKPSIQQNLKDVLKSIQEFSHLYICSGNDLSFLKKYIPKEILNLFSGHVLETGCVICDLKKEKIIISKEKRQIIKDLENQLRKNDFPQIKYYARRLCTISLFTRTENGGSDPFLLYPAITETVEKLGFNLQVLVTHSNVAVDIVPRGYTKFTGLRHVAGRKAIIGIADSYNDLHLVRDAHLSFIPVNASPRLIEVLEASGKKITPLRTAPTPSIFTVYQSQYPTTKGVVEILEYIIHNRKMIIDSLSTIVPV